jgi:alpha-tubulin suppressor-like RCC1 family protein
MKRRKPKMRFSNNALVLVGVVVVIFCFNIGQSAFADSIVAWGLNNYSQCTVPEPNIDFNDVAGGLYHSLGLKLDGSIEAWGLNVSGQCSVPQPNTSFEAIAAGSYHSLGLKLDGSIEAWGYNGNGQCSVPEPNSGFIAIAAGGYHSLGLKDGSIVAWGKNSNGQCTVPEPNSGFIAVAAGYEHSLGLKSDGSIVAWGYNNYDQCIIPEPNSGFIAVAGGGYHSLGLKQDGSIVAWGYNGNGQCTVPVPNSDFIAIDAGYAHSLGLKSDGSIVAWGLNGNGQCSVPEPNRGFTTIAAGGYHSLAIQQEIEIVRYTLDLYKSGNGTVMVNGTLRSLPWSGTFIEGTNVTLEAVPDKGWRFSDWSGDLSGSDNPTSIHMSDNMTVTANFIQQPSYGEILVYSVSINVTGVAGTVGEEGSWELGRGRFHGYLVCSAVLADEPNAALIVYGRDDTGDKSYEIIALILDKFYLVYNHPYVYTVGLSFDEAWQAVLTGNAEATDIGADGTAVVARRLTGHILINADLPLPLSDDEGYGSGTVKARLNLDWTREYNIEELTLESAVNDIIKYLEYRGYDPYYRVI